MAVLTGSLFFISLLGWVLFVKKAGGFSIYYSPVLTASGLGLLLYAGGLFGRLEETAVFLYGAGLVAAVFLFWSVASGRFTLPKMSLFCFFFLGNRFLSSLRFISARNHMHQSYAQKKTQYNPAKII